MSTTYLMMLNHIIKFTYCSVATASRTESVHIVIKMWLENRFNYFTQRFLHQLSSYEYMGSGLVLSFSFGIYTLRAGFGL